ncbi:MAG: hypothetical protein ACE5HZ_09670, partial [Fidelibacterota bacterium]
MLFVYPNPPGALFSLLRLTAIILAGFLFYRLYRHRAAPGASQSSPGGPDKGGANPFTGKEAEEELQFWSNLETFQHELDIVHSP